MILLLALFSISFSIPSEWFSAKSAWNAVLPDNAPISPDSQAMVAGWQYQVKKYGPWINVEQYSVPVYTVPADQPYVKVNLVASTEPTCNAQLQAAWEKVPLPPGAQPAQGTDKHLALWQPSRNLLWEFWAMEKNSSNNQWQARWGGFMQNVKSSVGFYHGECSYWGATATSLSLVGGLVLIDEIKSGVIEHALPLALVETKKGTVVLPAQRGDGWSTGPFAVPEGTRFRFPASLNITALGLPPFGDMLARALQKYGGLVRDTAGAVIGAYCEPAPPGKPDPYVGPNGFFKGLYPSQILEMLPWDKLEVVDPSWQPWNGKEK